MPRFMLVNLFFAGVLSACIEIPDLEDAVSDEARNQAYPRLVQLDGTTTVNDPDAEQTEDEIAALKARAKNLRKRAKKIRGPVIDRRTRRRMAAALKRHPI